MRIHSLLLIALFCKVCYGKGGNIPENTHANLQDSQHNVAEGPETVEESNCKKVDVNAKGPRDCLEAQNSPEATGQESTEVVRPLSPFLYKVDSSLFDAEGNEEDGVSVIKLTAKEGTSAKELKYGGKDIWSATKIVGSPCSSAVLYFDGDIPVLAILKTKNLLGKKGVVYKYHDGKQWKDTNEDDHKNKLTALKNKYKHAKPATLDLSNPDQSNINVEEQTFGEVLLKSYFPKKDHHISSVMEGEVEVWKVDDPNTKCKLVRGYAKEPTKVIYLEVESSGTKSRYFEKLDGAWNELKKDQFYEKAKALIGESGKNASLNISHPSRILCQSFDYTFAGNAIRLIVPSKSVSVTKLMSGTEEVYTLSSEEEFDHARVYLNKDKKPELVLVVTTSSGASKETYFELKGGKWVSCSNHGERMRSLVVTTKWESDFTMDISLANSTDQCTIFQVDLLGVTTKHLYPKAKYTVNKVKSGTNELWTGNVHSSRKGQITLNDYCSYCIIHKHGNMELLEMITVERLSERNRYFEKGADGTWNETDKTVFNDKIKEMRNGTPDPNPQSN
ncbi:signal peptide-containing protein [Theileria equi strain WA]|uniref:Signal peptide-containing protein n=1 Tax=Theileria equi strain WA TaxID=1537102 RepID=L0AX09_THEEQ|nr:signal peptide-containing protein [Theileria equi strain WA]AFZ80095.1 signal peptide-containing protein [Theileria equi strain WA]|eukprot:XP_004829761.1 signal peptide-containing protein [Theileria equi strain WA]